MSVLDPRQFLLPSIYLDPATAALLGSASTLLGGPSTLLGSPSNLLGSPQVAHGGGKMSNSSFRISDILHSPSDQNTSGDSDPSGSSEECRSSPLLGSPQPEDSLRGSPNEDGPSKKARKARTIFTDKQLQELETTFEKQKYLSVQDRMDLANRMGLSDTQVKTWYQNRRSVEENVGEIELETASACYFPFLEHKGTRMTCGVSSDCAGTNARCIYSLNVMRHICCTEKAGTIAPKCPSGYSSASLTLPVLCDPNSNHLGECPEEYKCVRSATDYTKDLAVSGPQSNYMCCKKI